MSDAMSREQWDREWTFDSVREALGIEQRTGLTFPHHAGDSVSVDGVPALTAEADEIERKWPQLYGGTPCGHYLIDAAGMIIQVNDTGLACIGYARDELVGKKRFTQVLSSSSSARFRLNLDRLSAGGRLPDDEYEMRRKDGTCFPVLAWTASIHGENGPYVRSRVSVFDISKRKLAQEELLKSELRNTAILHAALDCVISIDSAGRVIEFNPAAEKTFGYSRAAVLGRDVSVLIIPPRMRQAHSAGLLRYLRTRVAVLANNRVRVTAMRSDGTEFPAELTITPVDLQDETIFTAYLRDVSREQWAEQELRRYTDELRAMARRLVAVQEAERGSLASGLHDLVGQKLTALNINLNIVKSQLPADRESLTNSRLDESLALVDETIESIRDVMGALRPAVLDDYGLAAGLRWYAEHFTKRTGVATVVAEESAACRMPGSMEEAFFRIVQEALANVAKYAKASKATISLHATARAAHLTIVDDGCGFDATAVHRATPDSGWGLMIMRERAAAVGAKLQVTSERGKGTTVAVEWSEASS
jgi:PAS domain S-box-containing protein